MTHIYGLILFMHHILCEVGVWEGWMGKPLKWNTHKASCIKNTWENVYPHACHLYKGLGAWKIQYIVIFTCYIIHCYMTFTYLICDTTISSCIPGDEVCHKLLDPAAVLGAEVLSWQPYIPVWTGPQHGEKGHEVAGSVHQKLCWWCWSSGGDGGE